MAQLRVFSPDGPQAVERLFPLERDTVVIGREPGCDLVLQGTGASRRHAVLKLTAEGWLLVDQGSANGTLVLGQRVDSHRLRHGDSVRMGDSRMVFEDGPGAADAPRCGRCGATAAAGQHFCSTCGAALAVPPAPRPSPRPPPAPRKRGGCLGCLGCGCLLLVLLVAALATFILWRAGGIEGLTRRSIHTLRLE